jgi:uncharacterized protein (DUF2236 family)
MFVGELDEQDADRHYRDGMALGTTLQVPPEMWPPDRAAFDRYWQDRLDKVHIDDSVRDYLHPVAVGRVRAVTLPEPLHRLPERLALLLTSGVLPQRFRDEMRFSWDAAKQRRFDRLIAALRTMNNVLPRVRPAVPVQRAAVGSGPTDRGRPAVGVAGQVPPTGTGSCSTTQRRIECRRGWTGRLQATKRAAGRA